MSSVLTKETIVDESTGFYKECLSMSWEGFEELSNKIAKDIISSVDRITRSFRRFDAPMGFSGIYGFPRGGLVLAVKLSHILKLPLLMAPSPGCIVCDDISDSGYTLKKYSNCNYYTATLIMREGTQTVPEFVGEKVIEDNWILFPWEHYEFVKE